MLHEFSVGLASKTVSRVSHALRHSIHRHSRMVQLMVMEILVRPIQTPMERVIQALIPLVVLVEGSRIPKAEYSANHHWKL